MSRLRIIPLLAASLVTFTACDQEQPTATSTQPSGEENPAALLSPEALGRSLPFLSRDQRRLFDRGRVVFQTLFTPATGKGPLFNANGCTTCHVNPVVGGVGPQIETHATAFVGGVCDDMDEINGGSVVQDSVTPALFAALGITKEPLPAGATGSGRRTTPSVLGFGLLEAVPGGGIMARADPDDRDQDGVSGRVHLTADGEVGRFGRKGQAATLDDFIADAFIYEQGITNPDEPDEQTIVGTPLPEGIDSAPDPELSQEDLDATVAFVRFLAPPTQGWRAFTRDEGRRLFSRTRCSGCHTPALFTGRNSVRVLSYRAIFAYTDLLLHDMGPELADICKSQALPSEFRTEPLMGIRFKEAFLHDGRATTIEHAILAHGGEATGARDRFLALSLRQRAALLRFVGSL